MSNASVLTQKKPFSAEVWLTTADQSALFQRQTPIPFEPAFNTDYPSISIDTAKHYQTIDGFGFSLTGGSAYLINRLPTETKQALLTEIFSPDGEGIGVSYLRISIGASDLSERSFSYDDIPSGSSDFDLAHFNLLAGDVDVVPVLQEILAINPTLFIMAVPWSAPAWMKTNGGFIGGGLRPECYPVYAHYLVNYLQAMQENGISIHALSVQNEPLNYKNEPSMVMEAEEQAEFIKHHLGPALREAGFGAVELLCWDHNCDRKDYPLEILADPESRQFISGVAWHLYAGDISALSEVHSVHPNIGMYFTEQWVGTDGQFAGDLHWHLKNVMVGSLRNWSRTVFEWNLASEPYYDSADNAYYHRPHTQGGERRCVGALSITEDISRNVAYYVIAHAAKFVRPGSKRIFSTIPDGLPNVAFKTPDGTIVLIVLNDSQMIQPFTLQFNGLSFVAALDAGAVCSYVWPSGD